MKVLIVGSLSNYAIERFYLKYLNKNLFDSVECKVFTAQDVFLKFYNRSVINKLAFRIGYRDIYVMINEKLKAELDKYQPDHLLVFKGMEVFPSTLQYAIDRKINIINYNPDNPFIFSGSGSGNENVSESIKMYDLHFSYNLQVRDRIEEDYGIPCGWLPFGFEVDEKVYHHCLSEKEIVKACFIGNPDHIRANFIKEIAEEGIKIDVFGYKWNSFLNHKNITLYNSVFGEEFWKNLHRYRVQLNPLRIHNLNSHAMRSFEVPAIGGIMLAARTAEHEMFFNEFSECFYYDNTVDAIQNIKDILSLTHNEAKEIRNNARQRSLDSYYSYKCRAGQFLSMLNQFKNRHQILKVI